MSDKFLVEAPAPTTTKTYSQRRNASTLESMRKGQANNKLSAKQMEEERRRQGLNTSLFDSDPNKGTDTTPQSSGGGKAMELMMKMGWKVGEGIGKKRSVSPPSGNEAKRRREGEAEDKDGEEDEDSGSKRGLGAQSRLGSGRTEPIRISLWSGRKGLSARSPSPPPLSFASRNPDALDPRKMERLGQVTDDFRARQRSEFEQKEIEKKEAKARELLVQFDNDQGIMVSHLILYLIVDLAHQSFILYTSYPVICWKRYRDPCSSSSIHHRYTVRRPRARPLLMSRQLRKVLQRPSRRPKSCANRCDEICYPSSDQRKEMSNLAYP